MLTVTMTMMMIIDPVVATFVVALFLESPSFDIRKPISFRVKKASNEVLERLDGAVPARQFGNRSREPAGRAHLTYRYLSCTRIRTPRDLKARMVIPH